MSAVSCSSERRSTCKPVRELLGAVRDDVRLARAATPRSPSRTFGCRRAGPRRRRSTASSANASATRSLRPARPPSGLDRARAAPCSRPATPASAAAASPCDDTLDVERLGSGARSTVLGVAERFEDARQQRAELELVEEHAYALDVERAELEVLRFDADLDLAVEHRHLAVLEHAFLGLAEVLALLRRELVEVLEDAFEVAVGGDELRRRLLPDAGDAGKVVARVAARAPRTPGTARA